MAQKAKVEGMRMARAEPAVEALEQSVPAAVRPTRAQAASLTGPGEWTKLLGAHGRACSRVVKSRGEAINFPPRRLLSSPGLGSGRGPSQTVSLPDRLP